MIQDISSTKISSKRTKFGRKLENCWDLQVSKLSSNCMNTSLTKDDANTQAVTALSGSQSGQCVALHQLEVTRIASS